MPVGATDWWKSMQKNRAGNLKGAFFCAPLRPFVAIPIIQTGLLYS